MTRIANLEAVLGQLKTNMDARFNRLEKSLEAATARHESFWAESEKRHNELLALLTARIKTTSPVHATVSGTSGSMLPVPATNNSVVIAFQMNQSPPVTNPHRRTLNDIPAPFPYLYPPSMQQPDRYGAPLSAPLCMQSQSVRSYHTSRGRPLLPFTINNVLVVDTGHFVWDPGISRDP